MIKRTEEIVAYIHCRRCINELPATESPASWARLGIGWTPIGLQVWCERHDCNVLHIDFEGHQHPAEDRALTGQRAH